MNFIKKRTLLTIFIYLCLTYPVYSSDLFIDENFNKAISFIDDKNYIEAVNLLKNYIKRYPNDSDAHYKLGIALKALNNTDDALKEFEIAYKLSDRHNSQKLMTKKTPQNPQQEDYIDIGNIYFDNNEHNLAIEYYDYALKLNPLNDYSLYKIAKSYYNLENYNKANDFVLLALKINPSNTYYSLLLSEISDKLGVLTSSYEYENGINYNADFYNNCGCEFFKINNLEKAQKYFNKALDLEPNFFKAYNNLGNVNYQKGNFDKAIKLYKQAISINKDYSDAYFNLATVYGKKEKLQKQKKYLDRVIELNPEYYTAYLERSIFYYKKGDISNAKKDLNKLINSKKYKFKANYYLGLIEANSYDFDNALVHFKNSIEINKNNATIYQKTASVLLAMDKNEEALKYLKQAINLEPENALLYSDLGKIYFSLNRFPLAQEMFTKAIEKNQNDLDSKNFLAITLFNIEEYEIAKDMFIDITNIDKQRPLFHYNLSECYLQLNDLNAAQREFQHAVSITPERLSDYIDLVKIYSNKKMDDYTIATLISAIKQYPNTESLYLTLAKIYKNNGSNKLAQKTLKNLQKINPVIKIDTLLRP